MRTYCIWAGLALALAPLACRASAPVTQEPVTRATMPQIADALSRALPLSLEPRQLEDPAARERYRAALRRRPGM